MSDINYYPPYTTSTDSSIPINSTDYKVNWDNTVQNPDWTYGITFKFSIVDNPFFLEILENFRNYFKYNNIEVSVTFKQRNYDSGCFTFSYISKPIAFLYLEKLLNFELVVFKYTGNTLDPEIIKKEGELRKISDVLKIIVQIVEDEMVQKLLKRS